MPLGTEIGLDPGDIVLDGDQAPLRKGTQQPPNFAVYGRRRNIIRPISAHLFIHSIVHAAKECSVTTFIYFSR